MTVFDEHPQIYEYSTMKNDLTMLQSFELSVAIRRYNISYFVAAFVKWGGGIIVF